LRKNEGVLVRERGRMWWAAPSHHEAREAGVERVIEYIEISKQLEITTM
jgi:hypothetical protein